MGRYRPPKPAASAYITPAGAQQMRDELEELWKVERPKVTQAVTEAAALGDRSENADYQYGKRRLRQIDSRVRLLSKRLEALTIVEPKDHGDGKIYFAAWVTLLDEDDSEVEYRVVGPDESSVEDNAISMDSPMGKALIGRSIGDDVSVKRPKGDAVFEVVAVRYQ
ncbi:MAG: transcription elongation factor GreB [Myxococcales bacterium]|nr:transcription elongation factor GreB [Myxococcales bacterium]